MTPTIALITGASANSLGYAIAQAFLKSPEPYSVIITSRSTKLVDEAAEALTKETTPKAGCEVVGFELDLEKDEDIDKVVQGVESRFGRVDTLINNAGGHLASRRESR